MDSFSFAIIQAVETSEFPKSNDWSILVKSLGQFFFYVIIFIFVLALAYYCTKLMASARYMKKGNSNIQVMESTIVGINSSIQLVRAGKKYFLIGVTKERITFMSEVNEQDLSFEDGDIKNNLNFEKYLNMFFNKGK